ncbi:MAG: carboxypeptidase-like regulatory domain-containing protein, partial [Cyclobacteriaceae bacterium]|nr:carboxypeptidase-like regulatory domain-containing protein [Cyclobacteriaceae bacterium]
MRLNSTFLCLFFLLLFVSVQAQQKRLPLRNVLSVLEAQYHVSFTYSDENIENVSIDPLPDNISLAEVLSFLSKQTRLIFTQLDERFITISKPSASTAVRVCGTLVDTETNEKIVGATIQSNGKYAVSNTAGYFEFTNLTYGASLLIKFVGYETQYINV